MSGILIALMMFLQAAPAAQTVNGVITGQLRSASGTPMAGVRVTALTEGPSNTAVMSTTSDDAGRYRLENVPPGQYNVTAGLSEFPTYFPGVIARVGAGAVTVRAGGTQAGIDFIVRTPVGVKIRGRVVRPADQGSPADIRLSLNREFGPAIQAVVSAADGSFEFSGVPSGALLLRTEPPSPPGTLPLLVADKDIADLQLLIPRNVPTLIRITVDGGGPLPRLSVSSSASPNANAFSGPTRDGLLSVNLPKGPQYLNIGGLPAGYFIRSLSYGTTDLLKERLNLTAADQKPILMTIGAVQPPPWMSARGRVAGSATQVSITGNNGANGFQAPVNPDGTYVPRRKHP